MAYRPIPPASEKLAGDTRLSSQTEAPSAKEISANLAQAWAAALLYIKTFADRLKVAARSIAILIVLGLFGGLIAGTMLITAGVLLVTGFAHAIAALLHVAPWAGELITGLLVVLVLCVGGWIAMRKVMSMGRKQTITEYQRAKGR